MNNEVITAAQMRELRRAASANWPCPGVITAQFTGYGHRSWRRMMEKLVRWGYFTPYVHGGFEITAKGRELVQ